MLILVTRPLAPCASWNRPSPRSAGSTISDIRYCRMAGHCLTAIGRPSMPWKRSASRSICDVSWPKTSPRYGDLFRNGRRNARPFRTKSTASWLRWTALRYNASWDIPARPPAGPLHISTPHDQESRRSKTSWCRLDARENSLRLRP